MRNKQAIIIRAQELRDQHGGRVTVRELAAKLVAERPDDAVDAIEDLLVRVAKKPHLPEDNGQGTLFTLSGFVVVDGPGGWEYVPGDVMTTPEVESSLREVKRAARVQELRAERGLRDCQTLKNWEGFDQALPHNQNVASYEMRELEGGTQ